MEISFRIKTTLSVFSALKHCHGDLGIIRIHQGLFSINIKKAQVEFDIPLGTNYDILKNENVT